MKPSQHNTSASAVTTLKEVADWSRQLSLLHQRIAARFARSEPRARAFALLKAFLSPLPRKSCWQLAEQAREATPYGMQRLLHNAVCDVDGLRDDLCAYALEQLGQQPLILALDETSFPKQGRHSAGVGSQWCGSTGQVENCQVGVFLSLCTPRGHTLIDRELYVPAEWFRDPARCQHARIPPTRRFLTKPELATIMLSRFLLAHPSLPIHWVVADTVYGGNPDLRAFLEAHQLSYVLAISCQEPVTLSLPDGSCRRLEAGTIPTCCAEALSWHSLSCGQGRKGERLSEWACLPLLHLGRTDGQHFLLIRRSLDDPSLLCFFLAFVPPGTTLAAMALAWGARWHIEEDFEAAKDLGLDQYQVRSFPGWSRHITFVLLALAFLRALGAASAPASASVSLTPREASTLLARLLWPAPTGAGFLLAWSAFRRRHQYLAHLCHAHHPPRAG